MHRRDPHFLDPDSADSESRDSESRDSEPRDPGVLGASARDARDRASPSPSAPDLRAALRDYAARWPEEDAVAAFLALLDDDQDPFLRTRLAGHLTASAWLVDRGGGRILLTHHRKLDRWLQLGGHADGDRDLAAAALREACEESGLRGLRVWPAIFDLDRHRIPARNEVPAHWHYDVRYVVRAEGGEDFVVGEESHALAWRDIAEVAADEGMDPSLRRMARKWLAVSASP